MSLRPVKRRARNGLARSGSAPAAPKFDCDTPSLTRTGISFAVCTSNEKRRCSMAGLDVLPTEILDLVIEYLVVTIGIQKAVLLRTVSQRLNAAILHAICVARVIDLNDPATPDLSLRMHPSLRGKIMAAQLRAPGHSNANQMALSVVARVSSMLESIMGKTDLELAKSRCEAIAGAVKIKCNTPVDAQIEAQNLLSGAAIVGDMSLVAKLLAGDCSPPLPASIDLNASTPYFHDCLTLAAARGHYAAAEHLLECGARIDSFAHCWRIPHGARNVDGLADWNNHSELVRCRAMFREPPSALRVAVRGGHEQVVHLLLRPQYRLHTNSVEYLRAVVAGASSGRMDLIQALLQLLNKDISNFNGLGNEMLWTAVRYNQKDIVQWLLDKGVDVNAFPWSPYSRRDGAAEIAACTGNITMLRFLIERDASINVNPRNPLGFAHVPIEAASKCGQEEAVELLIEHGGDPSKALGGAAFGGQVRLVRTLLSRFPDLLYKDAGKLGRSAMCDASMSGNLAVMTALVEAGLSLHDGYEYPSHKPISWAKEHGRPWVVSHLKSLGARETNEEVVPSNPWSCVRDSRSILISERTWQWVGRY